MFYITGESRHTLCRSRQQSSFAHSQWRARGEASLYQVGWLVAQSWCRTKERKGQSDPCWSRYSRQALLGDINGWVRLSARYQRVDVGSSVVKRESTIRPRNNAGGSAGRQTLALH